MEEIGIVTLSLIIANGIVTYKGLNDYTFLDKFSFNVDQILVNKDYKRLITSGFLHADWTHFAFNMITLYLFSRGLESTIGIPAFLILYFASLIGGNLFALYIHKNHPDYTAIGASGAVSGLVFASIGLFPGMEIGFILLPVFIPAWLYGILGLDVSACTEEIISPGPSSSCPLVVCPPSLSPSACELPYKYLNRRLECILFYAREYMVP